MSATKAIGALALVVGASFGTTFLLLGINGMPNFHFLSEDDDYNTKKENEQEYKNKYGQTYGKYLVGVTTKNGTPIHKNDNWWEWSFNKRYTPNKTKTQDKFSEINDKETLKTRCTEAYKASNSGDGSIKGTVSENNQNVFLEDNIWLFCSPAEEKIKSVSEETKNPEEYSANGIYGDATKARKDLVSVLSESKGNSWFWNHQKDKYKGQTNRGNLQVENGDIKKWCAEAYKKTDSSATEPHTKENVFKWCSLSGTPPSN